MNRLIKAVDELALTYPEEFFIQTGNSSYVPRNCEHVDFMDSIEYNKKISECSVLVTHAGVGTIISGISLGKPVVVVPRSRKYGEHVDEHQSQIAGAFESKGLVLCCHDTDKLEESIEEARTYDFQPYERKGGNVEKTIMRFIEIFE
jgi:UDP-N-acetylglucosamine transferase subunit ALG13